jgi:hypothetical protein
MKRSHFRPRVFAIPLHVLVSAAFAFLTPLISSSQADADCVVMGLKNNAWVIRSDSRVKASIRVGDVLLEGDTLEVYAGNSIDLAFDAEAKDVVHIRGQALLKIPRFEPVMLDVERGSLYGFIEKNSSRGSFSVRTPSSLVTVLGTHFKVQVDNVETRVFDYQGRVRVTALDYKREPSINFVVLYDSEKTSLNNALGTPPSSAVAMTVSERFEVDAIWTQVASARDDFKSVKTDAFRDQPAAFRRQGARSAARIKALPAGDTDRERIVY